MNAAAESDATAHGIAVRDVGYRYPHAHSDALQAVDLHIPGGEIFGLLGPNGAGKSTMLSLLSGSLRIQSGAITIAGEALPRRARAIRRFSAIVPQEYAFYESLTGRQNLDYFGRVFGLSRTLLETRMAYAVDVCRLAEFLDRAAGHYSGGLKRRLNLAIGLLNEPRVLYLDEPTVGIDAESRRFIIDAVHALKSRGTTIVYTSHYMEEVEQLCDSVAVIDHGRVVLQERVEHLLRREGADSLQITLREPAPQLETLLHSYAPTHLGHKRWTLSVARTQLPGLLSTIERAGVEIERVQYGVSRLEKIYLELLLGGSDAQEGAR